MAYRLGAGSWIAVGEESTFGTASTSFNYLAPRPGDEDLSLVHEVIEVDALTPGRGMYLESQQKGFSKVEGTLSMDLRYGGGQGKTFAMMLSHLLQESAATAGADPYTHTWDFDYSSGLQAKGLTIGVYRDGDIGSQATDDLRQLLGCRPTAVTLSFEENAIVRADWTIIGKTAAFTSGSSLTPAFGTGDFLKLPSPAASPTAFCQVDWNRSDPDTPSRAAVNCRSGSLTIEQPSYEERSLQSPSASGYHYEDRLNITGSLELEFQGTGTTGDDVSNAFVDQELAAVLLTLEGSTAANATLALNLHSCLATASGEPHANEVGTIYQNFEFKALRNVGETSTTEGDIVLTNTESAAY